MTLHFRNYLNKKRASGQFLVAAGTHSAKAEALCTEAECDFICYYPTSLFSATSNPFLSGYFSFYNANERMEEVTKKERSLLSHSWLFSAVSGLDPFKNDRKLFETISKNHYCGVHNYPAACLIDGTYGDNMNARKIGFDKEVNLMKKAAASGLDVCAMVSTPGQAIQMLRAGADVLIFHLGFSGGKSEDDPDHGGHYHRDLTVLDRLCTSARRISRDVPLLFFSEQVRTVADIALFKKNIPDIDGYYLLLTAATPFHEDSLVREIRAIRKIVE